MRVSELLAQLRQLDPQLELVISDGMNHRFFHTRGMTLDVSNVAAIVAGEPVVELCLAGDSELDGELLESLE